MSRASSFGKVGTKKGPWSKEEDDKLRTYIQKYGHWNWREIPRFAGVSRCGKSCRLRWMNYLRPNMKHGNFTKEEEDVIMELHNMIGNKWATIASKLPGRSDNEIKNYWNTHLSKRDKQNQDVLKKKHDNLINNLFENPELRDDEVQALWASLSPEISSVDTHQDSYLVKSPALPSPPPSTTTTSYYSSSVEFTSSMFSAFDGIASSGDSIQMYDKNFDGNFWINPFLADYDSMRPSECSSNLDLFRNLIDPTSRHIWP